MNESVCSALNPAPASQTHGDTEEPEEKNTFADSQLESLLPKVKFSRRGFLASSVSVAGFALSAGPVNAQTAIITPADGLDVKDIKVPVAGGDMPG